MMIPKTRLIQNNYPTIFRDFVSEVKIRNDALAIRFAAAVADELRSGSAGVKSDGTARGEAMIPSTGAAAASMYVISQAENGYDGVKQTYQSLLGKEYSSKQVERLTFEKIERRKILNGTVATAASMSVYLAFWEHGHDNKIVGSYVTRPTLLPVAHWFTIYHLSQFRGILKRNTKVGSAVKHFESDAKQFRSTAAAQAKREQIRVEVKALIKRVYGDS